MTLNTLLAAENIAFNTVFLPNSELSDKVSQGIGEWAGDPFDMNPDAKNEVFYENEKIFMHEQLIRRFVTCIHHMILKQNVTAQEIILATFKQNQTAFCFKQLIKCHQDYMDELSLDIERNLKFTGKPENKIILEDAKIRRIENQELFLSLDCLNDQEYLEIYDIARSVDNDFFSNKILNSMEHAKAKNYRPYGYQAK